MKLISARRTISAGVVMAASVMALAAPGSALAAKEPCKGTNTAGIGSSLQAEAVVIWKPGFETNAKLGCAGTPKITEYQALGSGAGYKAWNEKKEYGTFGFVGTDNTVNLAEKESVEKEVEAGKESKLLTIPVLQSSLTVVVNLPAECTATSTIAANRLALNQSTLEEIYTGKISKWNELEAVEGAGNKLTGTGCTSAIQPVVRQDGSGTTHIFKKFLGISDSKTSFEYEAGKSATWSELAEGSLSTKWPTAAKVIKPVGKGNPETLKLTAATPGTIDYANLADARNVANGGFTGQSASRFWVELESSKKGTAPKIKRKYADPATNGDVAASAESNCKKTEYSNGVGSFPPPKVTDPWNEVTASGTSKTYALCGLTYDLALTHIEAYAGGTVEEAKTVQEYLDYVLAKKGGAAEIAGHDYFALPKQLVGESVEGVATIG
jgi:ABC-type phosphate transport system substrate-binding protein